MSPRGSKKTTKKAKGAGAKPSADVYVALLFVALAAVITGCIFLVIELESYDWQMAQ